MQISNIIVHQINKDQHSMGAKPLLRDAELARSSSVDTLLDELRKLYNKKSARAYGTFKKAWMLELMLRSHRDGESTFVEFSARCATELATMMGLVPLATGGYALFTIYEEKGEEYLMIVMLKSTPGMTFDEALELAQVHHLDLSRLHFAARINLNQWIAGGDRYISFVKVRAAGISGYFSDFIGVDELREGKEHTKKFVSAVLQYCQNVAKLGDDEEESMRARIHEYCRNKAATESPIHLEEFAAFVDEQEPERFLDFVNASGLSTEIMIDLGSLRPLVRYAGGDKELRISFNASALGKRVFPNLAGDTVTIRGIPKSLRDQLPVQ